MTSNHGVRDPDTSRSRLERMARLRRGALGELVAAALLMSKGYRILARRHRTPYGEIDIIAVRGTRIAFVEVKRRPTLADAQAAIGDEQARRIADAAEHWLARHPSHLNRDMGLDAVLVVPGRWPEHVPDVLAGV